MKVPILTLSFLLLIFASCKDGNTLKINFQLNKATVERVNGQYVYLKNINTKTIIDSLIINGEDNQFTIPKNTYKASETYSILMNDTGYINGDEIKIKRPLGYFNPYKLNEIYSSFYVEPNMNKIYLFNSFKETPNGKIELPNEFQNNKNVRNSISKQNDIIHKDITLSYSDTNTDERVKIVSNNIRMIETYPYSVLLLNQLFNYKTNFRINDLKTQLSYFNKDIKETSLFKNIVRFTQSNTSAFDASFPEFIKLENQQGEFKNIGNPKSKMNLIVYWSWWCGPCRKEIPNLRELYKNYRDKGLTITSISIDPDKIKWFETLKTEKMEWEQLIVSESNLSELQIHFDINAIPKYYLYDDKNKLIKKLTGLSETSLIELTAYLTKLEK